MISLLRVPPLVSEIEPMPGKNIIKEYVEGGIYHVYNRGINKQDIFTAQKDYATFLSYLKSYLSNPETLDKYSLRNKNFTIRKNFFERVDLLCYCLMSNHFHLLVRQRSKQDMAEFMRCIGTNYSMYFNEKNKRLGPVFQGTYKAVLVKDDNYLLHLSRYIHLNPDTKGSTLSKLSDYEWCSYADYLGNKDTKWINKKVILDYFEENKSDGIIASKSYRGFVENANSRPENILEELTLE